MVVILPDGSAFLLNTGLPRLAADRTYQLWGVVNGQTVSLGLLGSQPRDVAFTVNPAAPMKVFAVTDEVAGGVVRSDARPRGAEHHGLTPLGVGEWGSSRTPPDSEGPSGRESEGTHDESSQGGVARRVAARAQGAAREEKAMTRARDALSTERRELPMVEIDKDIRLRRHRAET